MKYPTSLQLLIQAAEWWKKQGFVEGSVPALVDPDVMAHTCPPGVQDRRLHGQGTDTVVASAEQSFLQLDKDGDIEAGPWMGLTPCYREEAVMDDTHLPVFLKLELFVMQPSFTAPRLETISLGLAVSFQRMFLEMWQVNTDIVATDIGWDVMFGELELGSFGTRKTMTGKGYVYGTGLAEPRASLAILMHKS